MNAISNRPLHPANGQNMGHCIAVWCTCKAGHLEDTPKPDLRLHINLWRLDRELNGVTINALDLGFRLSKATLVDRVHLFVPFTVDKSCIRDLGRMLVDADMAIAVFNEDAKTTDNGQGKSFFSIRLGHEELSCWKLDPGSDLDFESIPSPGSSEGSIITFKPEVFAVASDQTERYVRLRINLTSAAAAAFFTRYDPRDRRFLSGFDEIEVVDFRLNEARNLPRTVIDRMKGSLHISEINYFVIRDITDDLNLSHSEMKKCRTLESPTWSKYVQGDSDTTTPLRNAIIFYWQKKGSAPEFIKDYNALARFQRRRTGLPAIGWFLLSTLAIGTIAGLISGIMVTYLTPPAAIIAPKIESHTPRAEPNRLPLAPVSPGKSSTSD